MRAKLELIALLCVTKAWACARDQNPPSESSSPGSPEQVERVPDLKPRRMVLLGLKAEDLQALPVWTADEQRRFERPRDARDALAKNRTLFLDKTDEARCVAHQKWQAALKAEKDEFEKSRLTQSWNAVQRDCVAELAAVHEELPSYAVLKLKVRTHGYDFGTKGFSFNVDDSKFSVDRLLKLRQDVVLTSKDAYGNIYRCEIGTAGALYLHRAMATPGDGTQSPNPVEPSDSGLGGFILVVDDAKAKSMAKRLKHDDVGRSNMSLEIMFRPLPYGETPYVCSPEFQGVSLGARRMDMWQGDPIGFRFSIDGQPVSEWSAFDGLQVRE